LIKPTVSVIIPTRNRSELLQAAMTSVMNQTFEDFELIVVDDASEDATQGVFSFFRDERIKCVRHHTNRGEAASRNTGISHSKGEFIAFLDDDDQWLPEKLRLQLDLIRNSPSIVGAVYSSFMVIDMAKGITLGEWVPRKRGDIYRDMAFDNFVGTPSTVFLRKECFCRAGLFDKHIAYSLDYDMWIRISKEFHFDFIKMPLVKYYFHENQISRNLEIQARGKEALLKKHGPFFTSNKKAYSKHILDLGLLYRDQQKIEKARETFLKAIRIYPLRTGNYTGFMKCLGYGLLGKEYFTKLKMFKDSLSALVWCDKSAFRKF